MVTKRATSPQAKKEAGSSEASKPSKIQKWSAKLIGAIGKAELTLKFLKGLFSPK